jgi:hypothetical protein
LAVFCPPQIKTFARGSFETNKKGLQTLESVNPWILWLPLIGRLILEFYRNCKLW